MKNIFETNFDGLALRFVLKDDDVYVSRSDIVDILCDYPFDASIEQRRALFDSMVSLISDASDRTGAIISESTIGPVIQFHAAGNVTYMLAKFLVDSDSEFLKRKYKRINTFNVWYSSAVTSAYDHFGRTFMDMMISVKNRLDRVNPPIPVKVTYGDEMYTAECDELHLVTEASTIDELAQIVWELAPDMIEANSLPIDVDNLRLSFELPQNINELRKAR